MRRIGVALALVAASVGALLLMRTSAPPGRSEGTHGSREAVEGSAPRVPEASAAAGLVVDAETEAPVARARVTLYCLPQDSPKAPLVATFVTDEAGRFSIPLPQPEDATRLVVDTEGYPPQAVWFDPKGTEIRLERGVERTFAILDNEGMPAAGAEVGLYADWRLRLAAVEADAHGIATVRLAQGVSILVRFPGHAHEDLPRGEKFVLSPGFSIGGKVVDSAASPVAGAFVRLRQGGGGCKDTSEYAPAALTGPDGRFVFHGTHGCTCELTVWARGYCEDVRGAVPGDEEVRVVLLRPGSVAGIVVLPDGSPATGARVHPDVPYDDREIARTDSEGRFRIDGLDPRKRSVHAFADPDLVGSAEVAPPEGGTGEALRIVLRPRERSYVRVRVLDERGRPVPGVKVIRHFWRALALTDEEGLATVTLDDPEIDVELHLVPDEERSPLLCESEFETRSASSPDGAPVVAAVLREAVLVRLDAQAPDGKRIPEAAATFQGGHSSEAKDEEGWHLDPAATYRIRVWAQGYLDAVIEGWTFLADGPTVVATLRPCAALKGRVVDALGMPVGAISASFDAALVSNSESRVALACDADGTFHLEGLAEGSGRLVFSREAMGIPEAGVEIRTWSGRVTDVGTLTLVRPVTVTGRVVDSAGRPLGGAQVGMVGIPEYWDQAFSHADGTFRAKVPSFSRGDLVVRKGGLGTICTTIQPGAPRALGDIVLPAPGTLEVEAEGIDWKRIDYATIEVAWPGSVMVETALCCWEHEFRPCRLDNLAPGRYVVRLSVGDLVIHDEVGIAAGETAKMTFRLR